MESNTSTLEWLVSKGSIRCTLPSAAASLVPALETAPASDRIEGMLLGVAIGDSLGNTSESMLPASRRSRYGEIRDYQRHQYATAAPYSFPSDDTQLTFWALESILDEGGVVPECIARAFSQNRIYGLGSAVREFLCAYKDGRPWYEAGPEKAGNGALMRVAPLIVPSLVEGGNVLLADLALGSMLTHNDCASISACLAFGIMLRELLIAKAVPVPEWWAGRYIELASKFETCAVYTPRGGAFAGYAGTLSGFVGLTVPPALEQGVGVEEACNGWYSGAFLLETVPSVLYILARHAADPEEALVRAVNDTKDNDTIAAIVGAAIGALHGATAFPRRWLDGLSGRTMVSDTGKVQALARKAALRYGS